jgi:hypothetical protein
MINRNDKYRAIYLYIGVNNDITIYIHIRQEKHFGATMLLLNVVSREVQVACRIEFNSLY